MILTPEANWILLAVSDLLLSCLWSVGIHQLCITENFEDNHRLKRVFLIVVNISLFIALNTLLFISNVYPHHSLLDGNINVITLFYIVQATSAMVGFHTFRLMLIFIIDSMYSSTMMNAPKYFMVLVNLFEALYISSIVFCHLMAIFSAAGGEHHDSAWPIWFYFIFSVQMLGLDVFMLYHIQKPLNILQRIHSQQQRKQQQPAKKISNSSAVTLHSALHQVRVAQLVALFIAGLAVVFIVVTALRLFCSDCSFNGYYALLTTVMHSVCLISLSAALILWVYKRRLCFVIPQDSVCDVWCGPWCNDITVDNDDATDVQGFYAELLHGDDGDEEDKNEHDKVRMIGHALDGIADLGQPQNGKRKHSPLPASTYSLNSATGTRTGTSTKS